MQKFKDTQNTEWAVEVDFSTVEGLRASTEYDLLDHEKIIKLVLDSVQVYKLLWALVESQATERNVSALDFSKRLVPVFRAARDALSKEIADFFRACQQPDKALAIEEMQAAVDVGLAEFEATKTERLETIRQKSKQVIQTKLRSTFGGLEDSLDKMLEPAAAPGGS